MLNWISALGRVDITYATRKLARYNAAPRVVHWEAAKHIFGYLKKHPKLALPVDPTFLKSEPGVPIEVKNYDAELRLFKSLRGPICGKVDIPVRADHSSNFSKNAQACCTC